jgi:hypothetical protein
VSPFKMVDGNFFITLPNKGVRDESVSFAQSP